MDSMDSLYNKLGGKYISTIKAVAYIIPICSIVIALVIWIKFGTIKFSGEPNPTAIALGIELIIGGFIIMILLLIICEIWKNTISLRIDMNKLLKVNNINSYSNNQNHKTVNNYSDKKLEKLRQETNGRAVCFAEDLTQEWKCVCGQINNYDKKEKIQNCSKCNRNRDFVLNNYTRERFEK